MPSIKALISQTKNLTPLERSNFISENKLNDKLKEYIEQNPQDANYVILYAEQIAVDKRDFAGANTFVNTLNFDELTSLQQAHVRRLTGSYLGKTDVNYEQSIAHLQQAATLFKQNDNKQWLFNTLLNKIGVLFRFAEAKPGQVRTEDFIDLYTEIKSLKQYDDNDSHGMIVTSFYLASFYCLHNDYVKAEATLQDTKNLEQSRVLNIPPFIAMIKNLKEKINSGNRPNSTSSVSALLTNPVIKSPVFSSTSMDKEQAETPKVTMS